jgi:hypothetical protein
MASRQPSLAHAALHDACVERQALRLLQTELSIEAAVGRLDTQMTSFEHRFEA